MYGIPEELEKYLMNQEVSGRNQPYPSSLDPYTGGSMLGRKPEKEKKPEKKGKGGMWEAALITIASSMAPLLGRQDPTVPAPRPVQAPAVSVGSAGAVKAQSPFGPGGGRINPNVIRSFLGG